MFPNTLDLFCLRYNVVFSRRVLVLLYCSFANSSFFLIFLMTKITLLCIYNLNKTWLRLQKTVEVPWIDISSSNIPPYSSVEVTVRAHTHWGGSAAARAQRRSPQAAPAAPRHPRLYIQPAHRSASKTYSVTEIDVKAVPVVSKWFWVIRETVQVPKIHTHGFNVETIRGCIFYT